MAAKDRFESLAGLSRAIVVMLWIDIACQALYALASLWVIDYVRDLIAGRSDVVTYFDSGLAPSEIVQAIIGLVSSLVMLILFVMIGRWTYRAAWNVRHLGAKGLAISPGWAVGWHFVPFANLVYPFRAMKEIWLASHDPLRWQPSSVGLLSAWWALWLGSNFLGNVNFRMLLRAESLESILVSEWLGVAVCVASIPLSLVFIRITRRVAEAQDHHASLSAPPLPSGLVATAAV